MLTEAEIEEMILDVTKPGGAERIRDVLTANVDQIWRYMNDKDTIKRNQLIEVHRERLRADGYAHMVESFRPYSMPTDEEQAGRLWMHKNCVGLYRVDMINRDLIFAFQNERDAVLFKLFNSALITLKALYHGL